MSFPIIRASKIPSISVEEMKEIDSITIKKYNIDILQMMENAGRNLAILARTMLGGSTFDKKITIVAGKGNNAGGSLVAARHLKNLGATVFVVYAANIDELTPITKQQHLINNGMKIKFGDVDKTSLSDLLEKVQKADLLIDGLIGYNLSGEPKEPMSDLIEFMNHSEVPILSLDVPSGLDATTSIASKTTVKAKKTLTLALPKDGLLQAEAKRYTGKLYLADISIPDTVYQELGLDIPILFDKGEIVEIRI